MNPLNRLSLSGEADSIRRNEYVDSIQARGIAQAGLDMNNDQAVEQQGKSSLENAIKAFIKTGVVHLSMRSCNIGDKGASVIGEALKGDSRIVSLNLFGNDIADSGIRHIAHALRTNRHLRSLDLGFNNGMTNISAECIAQSFREMELESEEEFVELRNMVYLSEYGPEKVSTFDNIPAHHFHGDSKTAKNKSKGKGETQKVELLEQWESHCRMVGSLPEKLSSSKMKRKSQEDSVFHDSIRFFVPGNSTLKHIGLGCNRNLTDDAVHAFLQQEVNIGNLERLNFSQTKVTNAALEQLAVSLVRNPIE